MTSNSEGIRTFFKKDDTKNLLSVIMEAYVDTPLFNLLAVFYEIDLYPTWVPRQTVSNVLKREGRYRAYSFYQWDMPFPFTNRDASFYGYGIDMLEDNSILVVCRSIKEHEYDTYRKRGVNIPPVTSSAVRMECEYAG